MSLILIAKKSNQNVIKGEKYQVAGLIQNTDQLVLFDCPGKYSSLEIFGVKEEIIKNILVSEGNIFINI